MRTDTEEPETEVLSEREQDPLSEAEDELDPADLEATPTQDPKGKKPEVVILHPTPMKPIAIPETREDKEEREEREAHALIDSMFSIYHFHKLDGPRFEPFKVQVYGRYTVCNKKQRSTRDLVKESEEVRSL